MLLAVDIGNSNIVLGGYHGDQLLFVARIRTDSLRTEFEYAVLIKDILSLYHCQPDDITGGIVSSVVPPLSSVLRKAIRLIKKVKVLTIGPGIKTGLNIKIDNPGQLGVDLLATAIGAMEKYPLPAIIIDLGTATKITVVDKDGCFRGGAILPGVMIALDALSSQAAQLPKISLDGENIAPIGTNTIDCMKAGTILGAASMVDGMIERYKEILGNDVSVVACGGLVGAVLPHCRSEIKKDETLLLDGLRILYKKNTSEK